MCPVCMTTVALVATGSASVGGLAALVAKAVRASASPQPIAPKGEASGAEPVSMLE